MIVRRNRSKQTLSLDERLSRAAHEARCLAEQKDGEARKSLLRKARAFEAQIQMNQNFRKGGR